MATFVLVHGAWSGCHTWHKLRPMLWAKGHPTFTPCLTGLGERSHLLRPDVNLSTHVEDVLNVLFYEDLSDVVLVGHSYGGMVVTAVADRAWERIAHLVYVDAFLPADGQALYDIGGGRQETEDWLVPPMPRPLADPAEQAWLDARRRPHPRACFEEKLRLAAPLASRPFSRTYILATGGPPPPAGAPPSVFYRTAARLRDDPAWRLREIDTGHMVQIEKPAELTQMLLELA